MGNGQTPRPERSLMCDEGAVHWHGQAGLSGKGIGKNTDILKQVQPAVSPLRKVISCLLFFGGVLSLTPLFVVRLFSSAGPAVARERFRHLKVPSGDSTRCSLIRHWAF